MAKFEFEYTEFDGLLYPNIEIDRKAGLDDLDKYGSIRLNYPHEQNPEMYRELLLTGKLAEHCTAVDKIDFEMAEAHPCRLSENTFYAGRRYPGTYSLIFSWRKRSQTSI